MRSAIAIFTAGSKIIMISSFLIGGVLLAAPPTVNVPETVKGPVSGFIPIRATTDGKSVAFYPIDDGLNVFPSELLADKKTTVVSSSKPGKYRVLAYSGNEDGPSLPVITVVIVGDSTPTPTPEPQPEPQPKPEPKAVPIPKINGLAVLIVEEVDDRNKITPDQRGMIAGQEIRDWLNANCWIDPARSDWKAWRIFDQHEILEGESEVWIEAMKRPRTSLPWVIISNAKRGSGYEGPLPKTLTEFKELLKKHEGK